jgi:hypothetical protein
MVFLIKANLSAGVNNFILTTGSPNLTSVQDIENVTTQYVIDSTENISGWTFNEPQNWYFGNILISPNITDPLYEYHLVHSNGGWSLNGSTRYNYTIADLAPGGTSQIGSGTGPTSTTGPTISAAMLYSPNGSEYFGKTNSQFGYPHSPIIVSELEPFSGSFSNLVTNDFNESIIRHSVYVSNISEMTKTMETQITYDRSSDLKSFVFINMFDNSQIVSTSKPFIDTFSGEITSTNGVSNRVGTSSYDGIFNKGYINDNANYSMFYYKPPNTPVSNFSTDPELANFSATGDILKHRTLSTYTDQPSIYYNYSVRVSDSNSSSLNHITGGDTH